ncbi:MAG: serine/threonine protein kinase [Deltaproteobacteria bacterium]|nr:serine/threonine protein kinase [Deltaproteobacteria bacterium]
MTVEPCPIEEGTTIGQYQVLKLLGSGGMGWVLAGIHPVIEKRAAIKVLKPALAQDPDVMERFIAEAKAVNRIGHPNIVDIFSFGYIDEDIPYFVMEFLNSGSLRQLLAKGWKPSLAAFMELFDQVLSALAAAHEAGIVHRDLKPDNICLHRTTDRVVAKLVDFGVAKFAESGIKTGKTRSGVPIGTPSYMSPEQCRGRGIDHRSDIYALGVIMYETFTGRLPFESNSYVEVLMAHVEDQPDPPSHIVSIASALEAVIMRCLDKDPTARPQSVSALRDELWRCSGQQRPRSMVRPLTGAEGAVLPLDTDRDPWTGPSGRLARLSPEEVLSAQDASPSPDTSPSRAASFLQGASSSQSASSSSPRSSTKAGWRSQPGRATKDHSYHRQGRLVTGRNGHASSAHDSAGEQRTGREDISIPGGPDSAQAAAQVSVQGSGDLATGPTWHADSSASGSFSGLGSSPQIDSGQPASTTDGQLVGIGQPSGTTGAPSGNVAHSSGTTVPVGRTAALRRASVIVGILAGLVAVVLLGLHFSSKSSSRSSVPSSLRSWAQPSSSTTPISASQDQSSASGPNHGDTAASRSVREVNGANQRSIRGSTTGSPAVASTGSSEHGSGGPTTTAPIASARNSVRSPLRTVRVESRPTGAKIRIAGHFCARAPTTCRISGTSRKVLVRASKSGWETRSRWIDPRATKFVRFVLVRKTRSAHHRPARRTRPPRAGFKFSP